MERNDPRNPAWLEYDACASDMARRGKTGAVGESLPANMSVDAVNLINDDPEAFERRVRDFAYAHAMERFHNKQYTSR